MANGEGGLNGGPLRTFAFIATTLLVVTGIAAIFVPLRNELVTLRDSFASHEIKGDFHPTGVEKSLGILRQSLNDHMKYEERFLRDLKEIVKDLGTDHTEHLVDPQLHWTGFSKVRGEVKELRERVKALEKRQNRATDVP